MKVNARQVNDLGKVLDKTLDPKRTQEFTKATEATGQAFEQASENVKKFEESLDEAASHVGNLKRVRGELSEIGKTAREATAEVQRLNSEIAKARGAGGGAPSGGGSGGGGGGGGRGGGGGGSGSGSGGDGVSGGGDRQDAEEGHTGLGLLTGGAKWIGPTVLGALAMGAHASQAYKENLQTRRSSGHALIGGKSGHGDVRRAGLSVGMSSTEFTSAAAGYGQASARKGGERPEDAAQAIAGQWTTGVDVGTIGTAERALRGQNPNERQQGLRLLTTSIRMGFDKSRATQYLQSVSSQVETQTTIGARNLDVSRMIAAGQNLGLALGGSEGAMVAGTSITKNWQEGVANKGYSAGGDPTTFMLARAAGFQGGSPDDFAEAMFKLQDPSQNAEIMGNYLGQFDIGGGGAMQDLIRQQAMGAVGVRVHRDALGALGNSPGAAGLVDTSADFSSHMAHQMQGGMGVLQRDAAIQNELIQVGSEVISTFQELSEVTNGLIRAFQSIGLYGGVEKIAYGLKKILQFFSWMF